MCQDKDHGGKRCDSDTAEARRKRKKALKARQSHVPQEPVIAGKVEPFKKTLSMSEIKEEAQSVSKLLHAPCSPDPAIQDAIDSELEIRVTRLGLAIGEEVDRRAQFNKEEAEKEISTSELDEMRERLEVIRNEFKESLQEVEEYRGTMTIFDEDSEQNRELQRLKRRSEKIQGRMKLLVREINQKNLTMQFDTEKKPTPSELRLSQACREVIAELRPVGGSFRVHELSKMSAWRVLQETVGTHYPSSWIEASEKEGPVVIQDEAFRGSYEDELFVPSDDPNDVVVARIMNLETVENVELFHRKLNEDSPGAAAILGNPISAGGDPLQVLRYEVRIPFNPDEDSLDSKGNPLGEGWKKGYLIINGGHDVSAEKQWYRLNTGQGKHVAKISIPPLADASSTSLAYHEFCHRAESVVGEKDSRGAGLIERQEEAFLRRRTSLEDGKRSPLVHLSTPTNNPFQAEFGRASDLTTDYATKEYITSYSREVLSIGAEAAFGNRFGSFHGLHDKGREDLDHRGFVLGIFATA